MITGMIGKLWKNTSSRGGQGHIKEGKGKGIISRMLGTCSETAYQHRKNNNKKEAGPKRRNKRQKDS